MGHTVIWENNWISTPTPMHGYKWICPKTYDIAICLQTMQYFDAHIETNALARQIEYIVPLELCSAWIFALL